MRITPFLISANRTVDYGPVAAAADVLEFVSHARPRISEKIPGIVRREVSGPSGKMVFFSRTRRAGEEYQDGFGRDILRTDGICVSDDPERRFAFHPHYLEEAEKINDGYFEKFWTRTDLREGAAHVSETIGFRPQLREHTEGVTVLEAHEAPKKNEPHEPAVGAKEEPAARGASYRGDENSSRADDVRRNEMGGPTNGQGATAVFEREAINKNRLRFRASAVAMGAIGLGLIGHGILTAFTRQNNGEGRQQGEQQRSGWLRPLRILTEVGVGAGLTWAAYVQIARGAGVRRFP